MPSRGRGHWAVLAEPAQAPVDVPYRLVVAELRVGDVAEARVPRDRHQRIPGLLVGAGVVVVTGLTPNCNSTAPSARVESKKSNCFKSGR